MDDAGESIDDQADTATGGLTNDMPSIPVSPPGGGGRPPSALGGAVSAFHRMMGGTQAPPSLGPGPSPWQTPGQSQIQRQPQGGPRWQGNTASLFLPKGAPQPRASFTPFVSGPPTTSHSEWGEENSDYQHLPEPFETPSMYQNASKFFGENGSAAIIPLALSMGKNAGAFVNGVMQGQEWKAKMHREKMQDDAQELGMRQQEILHSYADITDMYSVASGAGGDPSKIGNFVLDGKTILDAYGEEAMRVGDHKMEAIVGLGSVQKVIDFNNLRNDNLRNVLSANKASSKQEEEDVKKELGIPESETQSNDPMKSRGAPRAPQAQPGAPPQPGRAAPGGAPAPTMAGGGAAPGGAGNPPDPATALQPYQEIGNQIMRGESSLNSQSKYARPAMSQWIGQQQGKIGQIAADKAAGKISDDQAKEALEKIMPGASADYQSIYEGNNPPPGAAARSPYWQSIRSIAAPDPITQQATKRDFASGGKSANRLTAGSRMSDAAITVMKEMKNFKEGELPPQNIVDQWIATGITGDPKWSNLFTAVNAYMQEAQSLQSPTGRFFETEMEEQRKHVKLTAGLPAIRGILKIDAENSSKLVDQLKGNYQRGTRDFKNDPTTYDDRKVEVLKALTNLDEHRGFSDIPPQHLPEELRGLGLGDTGQGGANDPGKVHDWKDYFK